MEETAQFVQPAPEKILLKWLAVSRPYKPQSRQFFSTAIVIAILISIVLVLAGEWMLIAVLAAMIFAYYVWSMIPPDEIEYSLTSKGVRIASILYPWNTLSRFWLEDKWEYKMLVVDNPTGVSKRLYLVLGNQNPAEVEEIMAKFVLAEKPEPTTVDKMSGWLLEKFPLEVR